MNEWEGFGGITILGHVSVDDDDDEHERRKGGERQGGERQGSERGWLPAH